MATLQHPESFVRWFRQVAPYLHAFRGRTFVVAFGGEMFAERARFASFIHDVSILAALGMPGATGVVPVLGGQDTALWRASFAKPIHSKQRL